MGNASFVLTFILYLKIRNNAKLLHVEKERLLKKTEAVINVLNLQDHKVYRYVVKMFVKEDRLSRKMESAVPALITPSQSTKSIILTT